MGERLPYKQRVTGSSPVSSIILRSYSVGVYHACLSRRRSSVQIRLGPLYIYIYIFNGSVAQLVEQWIEAPCVGSSILSRATMEG